MNKYIKTPDDVVDLHGYTVSEAKILLDSLISKKQPKHLRIITGRGAHGQNGPVIKTFVMKYLGDRNIRFNQSKIQDGGEGSLEVFMVEKY
ncbi:MAG: Smr/MutS family protein [Minisyncoccia bacterium]